MVEEPVAEEPVVEEPVVEEPVAEEPVVEEPVVEEPVAEEPAFEEPVVEELVVEEPQITVDLHLDNEGTLYYGDTVKLSADIEGAEGVPYSIIWQYDDGFGWKEIGGNSAKFEFVLDEANAAYDYRVVVVTE